MMGSKLQKKNDYEENQKIMISCIIGIMMFHHVALVAYIVQNISGLDYVVDDNTIRVIISRMRDKIGSEYIKTIRVLGYRLESHE